jgi:hypothetical protein
MHQETHCNAGSRQASDVPFLQKVTISFLREQRAQRPGHQNSPNQREHRAVISIPRIAGGSPSLWFSRFFYFALRQIVPTRMSVSVQTMSSDMHMTCTLFVW